MSDIRLRNSHPHDTHMTPMGCGCKVTEVVRFRHNIAHATQSSIRPCERNSAPHPHRDEWPSQFLPPNCCSAIAPPPPRPQRGGSSGRRHATKADVAWHSQAGQGRYIANEVRGFVPRRVLRECRWDALSSLTSIPCTKFKCNSLPS